jgi:O-antigen/teichoic acid export membrane protein
MVYPLHAINLNVLRAQGRSDLFFRLNVITKAIGVVALFVTFRWGIIVMIYGQIAASIIGYYVNTYYTVKLLKYPITEQVLDLLPTLGLATAMGGAVLALTMIPIQNQLILLASQVITGATLYVLLCRLLRVPSFMSMVEKIGPRLRALRPASQTRA